MIRFRKISKFAAVAAASLSLGATSASAAVNITWDFNTGGDLEGWTELSGTATTGNQSGTSDPGVVAGPGYAHDSQHPVLLFSSPIFTFNGAPTGNLLEVDFQGGQGNAGAGNPVNPAAVSGYNGGTTDGNGQKGVALLNVSSGNYDAWVIEGGTGGNGSVRRFDGPDGASSDGLTLTDLTSGANNINTADQYQLHFFDTDGGGWGWTRLNRISIDGTIIPEPSSLSFIGLSAIGLCLAASRRRRRK